MNMIDLMGILFVALWLFVVLIYMHRRKKAGKCIGCSGCQGQGSCSGCANCQTDKNPE